jgi:hypothetical protein
MTSCTAGQAAGTASKGAVQVGQAFSDFQENAKVAAPYLQEDLEKLWNTVAGNIEVYGADMNRGATEPTALVEAEQAREKLISGGSFADVVAKASTELSQDDLSKMPTSDLTALNGILPFDIDLSTCGENLAEVLKTLDIGQVSAILKSDAGYHLIQVIDRDGARFKIGHVVFLVDPNKDQTPASTKDAKVPDPMKEAIERLAEALNGQRNAQGASTGK